MARFGGVFEHSPWVARRAWQRRPFRSIDDLHRAMMAEVRQAHADEQLALVRAHPELAGREAVDGTLSENSSSEQGRLGFTRLAREEVEDMKRMNKAYREKFGFPCIVALALHGTRRSVTDEMRRRLANERATEMNTALEQIGHITRRRLARMLGEA